MLSGVMAVCREVLRLLSFAQFASCNFAFTSILNHEGLLFLLLTVEIILA